MKSWKLRTIKFLCANNLQVAYVRCLFLANKLLSCVLCSYPEFIVVLLSNKWGDLIWLHSLQKMVDVIDKGF